MIRRQIVQLLASVCVCVLLTQCAWITSPESRERFLKSEGYVPVALEKITGDVRYSGVFAVNGKPMRFLIDSGANSTDLSERYAKEVELKRDLSVSVITRGALGRSLKSGLGHGTLKIGPVYSENFPFTIGPESEKRTATSRYAGQIGLDAMSASGALIDLSRGSMWVPGHDYLKRSGGRPQQLGVKPNLGVHTLSLYPAANYPHLILEGKVDGRRVTWIVDTGAEVSVMAESSFEKFSYPSEVTNVRMIDAVGDRIEVRSATIQNVQFPGVYFPSFDLVIASLENVRKVFKDSHGRSIDGILGMDFLSDTKALLDPGSKVIYLGSRGLQAPLSHALTRN